MTNVGRIILVSATPAHVIASPIYVRLESERETHLTCFIVNILADHRRINVHQLPLLHQERQTAQLCFNCRCKRYFNPSARVRLRTHQSGSSCCCVVDDTFCTTFQTFSGCPFSSRFAMFGLCIKWMNLLFPNIWRSSFLLHRQCVSHKHTQWKVQVVSSCTCTCSSLVVSSESLLVLGTSTTVNWLGASRDRRNGPDLMDLILFCWTKRCDVKQNNNKKGFISVCKWKKWQKAKEQRDKAFQTTQIIQINLRNLPVF